MGRGVLRSNGTQGGIDYPVSDPEHRAGHYEGVEGYGVVGVDGVGWGGYKVQVRREGWGEGIGAVKRRVC